MKEIYQIVHGVKEMAKKVGFCLIATREMDKNLKKTTLNSKLFRSALATFHT
jgi:hypothetical protein